MGVYVPALRTCNFRCSLIVFIHWHAEKVPCLKQLMEDFFYIFRIVIMASVITLTSSMIRTTMPGRYNQMRGKLQWPWFSQARPAFQCWNLVVVSRTPNLFCLQRYMAARAIFEWPFQSQSLTCGSMGMHVLSAPYLSITWATWVGTCFKNNIPLTSHSQLALYSHTTLYP